MPVTFLAHQVPVLPIARRWPDRFDGVALVVGSMAPDMAFVLNGSRFSVWAHALPGLVVFCLPVTMVVSWLIVRVVSPVLWDHLPDAGMFRLRDYRGLAVHRFVRSALVLGALTGALSHVLLDSFTHEWGWLARNVDWYDTVVAEGVLSRDWTLFRVFQYAGHVIGTALCLWLLARYGRQRWMAPAAAHVVPYPVTTRSSLVLVAGLIVGVASGGTWVGRDPSGFASDVMRVAACCFAALVVICAYLLRTQRSRRNPAQPTTPASVADRR